MPGRTLQTEIWARLEDLTPNAKFLLLRLITWEDTRTGCISLGPRNRAITTGDTGLDDTTIDAALAELDAAGQIQRSQTGNWVMVRSWVRHQCHNANICTGVERAADTLPPDLRDALLDELAQHRARRGWNRSQSPNTPPPPDGKASESLPPIDTPIPESLSTIDGPGTERLSEAFTEASGRYAKSCQVRSGQLRPDPELTSLEKRRERDGRAGPPSAAGGDGGPSHQPADDSVPPPAEVFDLVRSLKRPIPDDPPARTRSTTDHHTGRHCHQADVEPRAPAA